MPIDDRQRTEVTNEAEVARQNPDVAPMTEAERVRDTYAPDGRQRVPVLNVA